MCILHRTSLEAHTHHCISPIVQYYCVTGYAGFIASFRSLIFSNTLSTPTNRSLIIEASIGTCSVTFLFFSSSVEG